MRTETKKSLDKFNSRLNTVKHKMNELEDKSKEYTEAKAQGGKTERKRETSMRKICGAYSHA